MVFYNMNTKTLIRTTGLGVLLFSLIFAMLHSCNPASEKQSQTDATLFTIPTTEENTMKNNHSQGTEPFVLHDFEHAIPGIPMIKPWKNISIDPKYGGNWVLAADLDQDGEVEFITAKNVNENDVHYTSAVAVQKMNGQTLWQWGNPAIGRKGWSHDVAVQVHDWNQDGALEVILLTEGFLVELAGTSGEELRRIPIPTEATDSLVFANLAGDSYPSQVLIKNRYEQIWALDYDGSIRWTIKLPGGYRTAHQPFLIDLDNNGIDEIVAGYAVLNADGTVRWVYQPKSFEIGKGHLDCCRVLKHGTRPEDIHLVFTCCGDNAIACLDGLGNVVWEKTGEHFESVDIGMVTPNATDPQMVVDVDHLPRGKSKMYVMDNQGELLGTIHSNYCRHHALLDWTGSGKQTILSTHGRSLISGEGQILAKLEVPVDENVLTAHPANLSGEGREDILLVTENHLLLYKNTQGISRNIPLGTGMNVTLY